jgi:hypothetical protein
MVTIPIVIHQDEEIAPPLVFIDFTDSFRYRWRLTSSGSLLLLNARLIAYNEDVEGSVP